MFLSSQRLNDRKAKMNRKTEGDRSEAKKARKMRIKKKKKKKRGFHSFNTTDDCAYGRSYWLEQLQDLDDEEVRTLFSRVMAALSARAEEEQHPEELPLLTQPQKPSLAENKFQEIINTTLFTIETLSNSSSSESLSRDSHSAEPLPNPPTRSKFVYRTKMLSNSQDNSKLLRTQSKPVFSGKYDLADIKQKPMSKTLRPGEMSSKFVYKQRWTETVEDQQTKQKKEAKANLKRRATEPQRLVSDVDFILRTSDDRVNTTHTPTQNGSPFKIASANNTDSNGYVSYLSSHKEPQDVCSESDDHQTDTLDDSDDKHYTATDSNYSDTLDSVSYSDDDHNQHQQKKSTHNPNLRESNENNDTTTTNDKFGETAGTEADGESEGSNDNNNNEYENGEEAEQPSPISSRNTSPNTSGNTIMSISVSDTELMIEPTNTSNFCRTGSLPPEGSLHLISSQKKKDSLKKLKKTTKTRTIFSRMFSKTNECEQQLPDWKEKFPELIRDELLNVHKCHLARTSGHLFVSDQHFAFAEITSSTNPRSRFSTPAQKKIIPFASILFLERKKRHICFTTKDSVLSFHKFESAHVTIFRAFEELLGPYLAVQQSLHTHINEKDAQSLYLLLNHDTYIPRIYELNSNSETPLANALRTGDCNIVKLMLGYYKRKELDINQKDNYGYTPLHVACLVNIKDEVLLELLSHPGIDVNILNNDGNVPLHYFCKCFLSPSCQDIAAKFYKLGANLNMQNSSGETPLHKSILNDSVRVLLIDFLIENGADVNIVNNRGESPLHYAVRLGRKDVVTELLAAGADSTIKGMIEMKTPYQLALDYPNKSIAYLLAKVQELYNWLSSNGFSQDFLIFFVQKQWFKSDILTMSRKEAKNLNMEIQGNFGYEIASQFKELWRKDKLCRQKAMKNAETIKEGEIETVEDNIVSIISASRKANNQYDEDSSDEETEKTWIIQHVELEFTKKLGVGAAGKVYRGIYSGKDVAIKVFHGMPEWEEKNRYNDPIVELMEEIKVMNMFEKSAPEIVTFHGVCVSPVVCLVMEYCQRGSLYDVLRSTEYSITWGLAISIAKQFVKGIARLHSASPQVLHRDLKSGNILVTTDWQVKVADFGLARQNTQENKSVLGKMCGTIAYAAPELLYGNSFDSKADVYSIGVVLWELTHRITSGQYSAPFAEYEFSLDLQIMVQAAENDLRPTIPETCPKQMSKLLQACWHAQPNLRPTAEEIFEKIVKMEKVYEKNKSQWDAVSCAKLTTAPASTPKKQNT
eukprot:CAMPEP_0174269954 /NCGR_PEP_ID=MMETSP0439-20130205/42791_1 /TAXON_ID=0 /ORGANISM="Stereomyxa ramosa, Strain Chinc5" /LENGTH=1261 /DNA_ID=CAMNT_0015358989 /DNA_START=638 /DNA_END=4423 /DNA_ORIENTATION=-